MILSIPFRDLYFDAMTGIHSTRIVLLIMGKAKFRIKQELVTGWIGEFIAKIDSPWHTFSDIIDGYMSLGKMVVGS